MYSKGDTYPPVSSGPENPSPVARLVSAQEKLLSQLHNQLVRLEERLQLVLPPAEPPRPATSTAMDAQRDSGPSSPLMDQLRSANNELAAAALRLEEILNRVLL